MWDFSFFICLIFVKKSKMLFSIIIPVYNRPDEINELLESLCVTTYKHKFEVVIVEDGSTIKCEEIVSKYQDKLQISYYYKENSGPGDSRNYGMKKAKGEYFLIFDSDCIIPPNYLQEVENELTHDYVDCFGGPDKALKSFSTIQKAINFAMTSFLTTGGIRGGSEKLEKFQPRSFNMGISKQAFLASQGFGNIHPGEDPDLSIRLWKMGYKTRLFVKAFVYHKRRIDWDKFSIQVSKFGKARPILNHWYPEYAKIMFWLPTLFVLGFYFSLFMLVFLIDIPIKLYFIYFVFIFVVSAIQNKSLKIGAYSIIAVWKQFFGYGQGFLESFFRINILRQTPQEAFPNLFFAQQITDIEKPNEQIVTENTTVKKELIKSKIIGITGGIGSGKTTVAKYLMHLGYPVYISDIEAKNVMQQKNVLLQIVEKFGSAILDTKGVLQREKLASIVFNNPEKLSQLNAIVHPAVKQHFIEWLKNNQDKPIVFKEAAILFESGSYKDCDFIITVTAPMQQRIERVMKRDNTTSEKVVQRINNQISDEERIAKSNFVISNTTLKETEKQIFEILEILKNK
ncbi:dephospho-CoA kinase [Flavobacterium croceum DSM 17960]|uniref:Dephospho-CoA kinase n=1 Tax=Flavobacterium croceum DSM 17960 TaxID=1121886 RepID=A0A2S4NAY1_9FLAO|nr:dephospho-CoA kinase [Flavobacterium croceum DSM 17960]